MINFTDDNEQLFQQYFKNQLSDEDRLQFEKELESNPAFKEDFLTEKALRETIFSAKMTNLGQMMDSDFEIQNNKDSKKWWNNPLLFILLGVTAVVSTIYLYPDRTKNDDNELTISIPPKTFIDQEQTPISEEKKITPLTQKTESIHQLIPQKKAQKFDSTITKVNLTNDTIIDKKAWAKKELEDKIIPKEENISISTEEEEFTCPPKKQLIKHTINPVQLEDDYAQVTLDKKGFGFQSTYHIRLINLETEEEFHDLDEVPIGQYQLILETDKCSIESSHHLIIKRGGCSRETEGIFSPNSGNEWQLRIDENRQATLNIRDQTDIIYHYTALSGDDEIVWDGIKNDGNEASIGLHFYELKYDDGEICRGSLTIAK